MKSKLILLFLSALFVLSNFSNSLLAQDNSNKFVVVLDAGHGGKDPGKPSKEGYKEKDIALKIALEVGKELEKNPDIKVVYTRTKDVFVDLFKRGKIANEAKADLFVSIHCNAHHTQAYGSETYVLGIHRNDTNFNVAKAENEVIYLEDDYEKNYEGFDPNSPGSFIGLTLMQEEYLDQSILLASLIQDKFTNVLKRKNRGVKQAGFIVLHQTIMPSVLVETGFITNKAEGAYLNSNKGQKDMATAIEKAILDYKNAIYQNVDDFVYQETQTEETLSTEPDEIFKNVVFKVQIAASSKEIELKPYNFKGLEDVTRDKINGLYKYFYGYTSNYTKIKEFQNYAKSRGYVSSFIVAYKDGKQIPLEEALKSTAN
ncbi:N-acetylmuramoyl-L-alanine amidase [Xanthomarina sp.]|uniref:N-acetylmuramoyl-L-alanine amidase n=1 Tax=Xanthomarina gelatinilytica TaxID=1137281 RepID=A0A3D6BPG8_9FLAO|nr:N-acetylmuramoyl-L-alanine amidase [Xanthomarina sp.]MAL23345.1 N-acetylmuramoyl-L-alanine amidase [Xanthomarina sp.]HCY81141.1 N-acetylmuramoyl-L-alanine amidase [Xanthomarina gelatinilytica]